MIPLITALLNALTEACKAYVMRLKVENYDRDIQDDEYIKTETELANSDIDAAPAHIANAELRQQQKVGRHQLQQISPL